MNPKTILTHPKHHKHRNPSQNSQKNQEFTLEITAVKQNQNRANQRNLWLDTYPKLSLSCSSMVEHTPKLPRLASQAWILKIGSKITKKGEEKKVREKLLNVLCFYFLLSAINGYIYPRSEISILPLGQLIVSKGSQEHIWYFPPIR